MKILKKDSNNERIIKRIKNILEEELCEEDCLGVNKPKVETQLIILYGYKTIKQNISVRGLIGLLRPYDNKTEKITYTYSIGLQANEKCHTLFEMIKKIFERIQKRKGNNNA